MSVIPKVYKPIFSFKVKPVKGAAPTKVISINGEHYIPIVNQTIKPIIVEGKQYIPVHKAPETLDVQHPIQPKVQGKINTFTIGNKTYIPLQAIPKTYRSIFKPVVKKTPTIVI